MRILVLEEKHGTAYLDASTEAKLYEAALSVVKSRLHPEWGFYCEEDPPEPVGVTQEDIDKLPDGTGKNALVKQLATYKRELEEYERINENYANAKKAVETKDGKLAWRILLHRSDWEYEGVYLAEVKDEYGEEE